MGQWSSLKKNENMSFFDIKDLPEKEVISGIKLKSAYLNNLMITMVNLAPGAVLPEHSHPHEQISYCVSGSLELTVSGQKKNLTEGQGATVASNEKHSGVAGPDGAFFIDAWNPVREDYIVES